MQVALLVDIVTGNIESNVQIFRMQYLIEIGGWCFFGLRLAAWQTEEK